MPENKTRKQDILNAMVIGFALFATFFGAGNLIFPPSLGESAGKNWVPGFITYVIADAGVAVAAVLSAIKTGGGMEGMLGKLGRIPARVLSIILMLLLGPLLTVPRTGATTYEMSVAPQMPGLSPWIFSVIFFGLVALLTVRPAAVVDIIGKFLTPVLLITLIGLCVKGIVSPLGEPAESQIPGAEVRVGLTLGYQTLDALIAAPLCLIIARNVQDKGYRDRRSVARMISYSSLIAFEGLFVVYAGLSYLGATVSGQHMMDISGTELMVEITRQLLARAGTVLLGVIVLLACLTTAIGTTSAVSDYLSGVTKNKVSYTAFVLITCAAGVLLSNLGTARIITLAEPVLTLLYPVFLTQVFLNFFAEKIRTPWVFRGAAIGAAVYGGLYILPNYFGVDSDLLLELITAVPLADLGLGWLLPAVVGGIVGAFIRPKKNSGDGEKAADQGGENVTKEPSPCHERSGYGECGEEAGSDGSRGVCGAGGSCAWGGAGDPVLFQL